MTTYELYINDILCDLSSDEVVTLLYQSPIFSSLDSIQSNRSYNVALPPTPTNMQAIGQAARPDVDADAPYVRLPAALYQDGVPLFTQGFAVVTDIADTINVTLTWGNVDNFQPLFDNGLRDLGPQLEELEAERIDWNENTTILEGNTTNEYPGVAFWGVNFGMGLSNPKYLHPSVQVKTILSAIEKYNGITIDGKERLAYSKNLGPIIPLVSKNGDEISNEAEALRFTANSTNFKNQIYGVLGRGNIIKDPHEIAYGSCTTKFNKTDLSVHITIKPSNGTGAYGYFTHRPPEWGDPKEMHIMLTELDGNSEIVKSTILGTSYNVELVGSTGDEVNVYRFNFVPLDITYPLIENTEILLHYEDPAGEIYISNPYSTPLTVNIWANWTDCAFPTRFPVAPNLPDISQGDFILALMSMNGLFAYADKDSPNTIKLISIDDIIANVQKNDIIDWSDRVILNDFHRVDMPDASIFTIDDLAQSNILDYDNDDDVKTDTYGTITIRNENIEKETELVSLPFSASENATTNEVNCALVPIYEDNGKGGANYSECSPRILSGRGAFMSGIARCIGVFDPWMKFGGEEGIVKTRYASYQKVVDRLRIITIRAKLTALDLYNLDYTKPVYIAQFGQIFAIYSVETGENDICDCQLLKLKVDGVVAATYYLRLDGKNEDSQWVAEADGINGTEYAITSNGTPYIVDYDSRLYVDLYEEDGDAAYNAAAMLLTGRGVPCDPRAGYELMLTAAEQDCIEAQLYVAMVRLTGCVGEPDTPSIRRIPFHKPDRREAVPLLESVGAPDERLMDRRFEIVDADEEEAIYYMRKAAHNQGDYTGTSVGDAEFLLAKCADEGFGREMDHDEAAELYLRAAAHGSLAAQEKVKALPAYQIEQAKARLRMKNTSANTKRIGRTGRSGN